jgi:hypothetical protein
MGAKVNNFTLVLAVPTWQSQQEGGTQSGLLSSNWSFSYNQLKNFDRNVSIKGPASFSSITDYMSYFTNKTDPYYLSSNSEYSSPYDNPNVSWLSLLSWDTYLTDTVNGNYVNFLYPNEKATPNYQLSERGHINKYSLGWSGNISNVLFLGTSLDFTSINHSTISTYSETLDAVGSMSLQSMFSTQGAGLGLNLGFILKPVNYLRLGLSLHTPTLLSLTDHSYSNLNSRIGTKNNNSSTPDDIYYDNYYMLQGPMQVNASAAVVFDKGLISAEYVYNNSTGMKLMNKDGVSTSYDTFENQDIKTMLNNVHTYKFGGEYRLNSNVSLRAGYAFKTASTKENAVKYLNLNTTRTDTEFFINNSQVNYYSGGIGYREGNWFFDLAYQLKNYSEIFYPYDYTATQYILNNTIPATVKTITHNLVATVGLKF